jgi:hypothetical protein
MDVSYSALRYRIFLLEYEMSVRVQCYTYQKWGHGRFLDLYDFLIAPNRCVFDRSNRCLNPFGFDLKTVNMYRYFIDEIAFF